MFSGTHVLEEKKDGFINAVLQVEQEFRDIIANSFSNDPSFFKFFELACKKFISQFKNGYHPTFHTSYFISNIN